MRSLHALGISESARTRRRLLVRDIETDGGDCMMCRFDVCDGGKVAAMFLKDHACPSIPDAAIAQVQHTSLRPDSLQHTEKVCS